MGQAKDLTGQIFGVLKVLERDNTSREGKPRVYYKVQCLNCGNIYSVRADGLKRQPQHCVKCKYPILTGKTFGYLTVLGPTEHKDSIGHKYWLCKCARCGTIKEFLGTHLIEGKQLSCGCAKYDLISQAERKDIIGQKFGQLTVIELDKIKTQEKKKTYWICQCECQNYCSVQAANLLSGHTNSCGCIHSLGEYTITQILLQHHIDFKTQYIFKDFPNRRFDFAIFQKDILCCLIEYDGKQHFQFVPNWHQTMENFHSAQQRDNEKNIYCQNKKIVLYRIRFDENIEERMNQILTTITTPNVEEAQEDINDNT